MTNLNNSDMQYQFYSSQKFASPLIKKDGGNLPDFKAVDLHSEKSNKQIDTDL